jgi:hypothetical protein
MKKRIYDYTLPVLLMVVFVGASTQLFSQIKIGENPKSINADAMLEIESTTKGLLLPRIALKSTTSATPLKNFTQGMVVYNTSSTNDLTPGLYYCDGTIWIKATTSTATFQPESYQNDLWSINGNNNVTTKRFLGSINNAPLIMKTNNVERFRITEKGWLGIGTTTPKAALQVKGQLIIDTLSIGDQNFDKVLVANPSDGRIKYLPTSIFSYGVQNYSEIVSATGKNIFPTPSNITDINKIFLYRNGVLISFTFNSNNSIMSEIPCKEGDQIRIVQLL